MESFIDQKYDHYTSPTLGLHLHVMLWRYMRTTLSYKNTTIYSRIIKDNYPDYEKVIPLDNNKTLTTNKQNLINAIKRVSIFSNRATKQITLTITNKQTTISTEDAEQAAKGKETIESQFNNTEELKIGFNSNFILEALGNIKNENITMFLIALV